MGKLKNNNQGFSAVESVLVLAVVVLIGVVGFMVYNNHKKTGTVLSTATKQAAKKSPIASKPVDPYAGWQSFCSDVGGLCVKYPSTWVLKQDAHGNATGDSELNTITNPNSKIAVSYTPKYGIGGVPVSQTITVNDVLPTVASDFNVVELLVKQSSGYAVEAFVTTKTQAHENIAKATANSGYADGGTVNFTKGATIQNDGGSNTGHGFNNPKKPNTTGAQKVRITNASNPLDLPSFTTSDAAQAWLNSAEVKTAVQILTSLNYKQ